MRTKSGRIINMKSVIRMFFRKWFLGKEDEYLKDDVQAIVISDVGNVRTNNEDNAIFIRPSRHNNRLGYLAVVADGMGGHQAGEVASKIAIDVVGNQYYKKNENPKSRLFTSLSKANQDIWQRAQDSNSLRGMGTTCTAVAIVNEKLYVGHIGDSRLYLFKNDKLIQVTTDHTYVQELIKQGAISPEDAENHPERNVLTKVMGTKSQVDFDVFECKQAFESGDRLLMCSDGLYEYFTTNELAAHLREPVLSKVGQGLVELAKQRGGHDNITLIVIEKGESLTSEMTKKTGEINLT